MYDKELFLKIKYLIMKHGEKVGGKFEQYQMLDATYLRFKTNDYDHDIISTSHINAEYQDDNIRFLLGDSHLLYKLWNRLNREIEKQKQECKDYLNKNIIELNGMITIESNGECYDHAKWGELIDYDKYNISLNDLLINNEGRKAKIIIQFED